MVFKSRFIVLFICVVGFGSLFEGFRFNAII